jgi:HD-like signal output (HDOD) protein/CheY-like chemotaxis protein
LKNTERRCGDLKDPPIYDEFSEAMKRILFVDDEPNVLDGLRGLLRKQRNQWEMSFVGGGELALKELLASPYDVIVSDMRMPGMDGAALLRKVQQDYPHIVRIVLSGQTEQEISRRMVHVAHQFLSKPCDGRELQQVIEHACKLQALLEHPALRQTVGQIGQLPIKPGLYTRLVQVLENPSSSMADAAAVIEKDIATSTKMLQLVNSAFFGLPQRVGDIKTAVSYLGLEMVKTLSLSVEMRQSQANVAPCPGFNLDLAQELSLLAARIGRRLVADRILGQDAFSAAMLRDTGALVLMARLPEPFRRSVELARASRRPIFEVETEVIGVSHAEIGAYLLGIWGLPYSIVEAVAYHGNPQAVGSTGMDTVTAVHIASALAEEILSVDRERHIGSGIGLDLGLVERLGLQDQLPTWRQIAAEEAQKSTRA